MDFSLFNIHFWVNVGAFVGWSLLLSIWILHLVIWRKYKIRLHYLMTIVPICKIIQLLAAIGFEVDCSLTKEVIVYSDYSMNACFRHVSAWIHSLASVPYYTSVVFIFILISMGYGTVFARMRPMDKRSMVTNVFVFCVCLIASKISVIFELPLLVLIFITIALVFTNILLNLRRLQLQLVVYRDGLSGSIPLRKTPPFKKKFILKRFQFFLSTYFFLEISLKISEILLLWSIRTTNSKVDWIATLLHELFEITFAFLLGFTFRLRSFKEMDRFNDSRTDYGIQQQIISQDVQEHIGFNHQLELATQNEGVATQEKRQAFIFKHRAHTSSEAEYSVAFLEM